MPNVEIKIHGRTVDTIALGDLPLTIGRDAHAEITIPDQAVSRRHAVLERDGAEVWRIRDLKSRNGTYVDGMRVDLAPLEHGCLIHVGSCCLIFHHALSETEEAPVAGPTLATVETASKVKTLGELPAPKLSTERVRAVIDFAARMMREQETLRRMRMVCELLVASTFPAEQAVVVRSEAEGPIETVTECIGACRAGMVRRPDEPLSRTLLVAGRDSRATVLAGHVSDTTGLGDARIMGNDSPSIVGLQEGGSRCAVACVLRRGHGDPFVDLLYVVLPGDAGNGESLTLLDLVATQYRQCDTMWAARAGDERRHKLERDLEHGRRIQQQLLPEKHEVTLPGLDIALDYEPHDEVGGDYVDVIELPDQRTLVVVADACGKGIQAALTASRVHAFVHAVVHRACRLEPLMRSLDGYLIDYLPDTSFVTMVAVLIDGRTGAYEVINCGHPPPIVAGGDPASTALPMGDNFSLGFQPGEDGTGDALVLREGVLSGGQSMVLYSDGASELSGPDGHLIGIDGLSTLIEEAVAASPTGARAVILHLKEALGDLQGDGTASDDRALLCVRRT